MHSAPAVGVSLVRSRWHLWVVISLSSLGLGAVAALIFRAPFDASSVLIFASWLLCTWAALIGWAQSPIGLLQWDGHQWGWSQSDRMLACRVEIFLDFQSLILVRVYSVIGPHFCVWLDSRTHAPKWIGLRRALISGQRSATLTGGGLEPIELGELP